MKHLTCLAWVLNVLSGAWLIYPHQTFTITHHELAVITFSETLFIAFVLTMMISEIPKTN